MIIWEQISITDINKDKLTKQNINPFDNSDLEELNDLLNYVKDWPQIKFTPSGGIKKCYSNMGNCWYLDKKHYEGKQNVKDKRPYSGTNQGKLIVHDIDKGWCFITINVVDESTHDAIGTSNLANLIKQSKSLRQEISDNEEENLYYKQISKEFYNKDNLEIDGAFLGIPEESQCYCYKDLKHIYSLDLHKAFPSMLRSLYPNDMGIVQFTTDVINGKISKTAAVAAIGTMASDYTKNLRVSGIKKARCCLAKVRYNVLLKLCNYINKLRHKIEDQGGVVLNMRIDSIKFYWNKKELPLIDGEHIYWDYEWKDRNYWQASTGKYESCNVDGSDIKCVVNGKTALDYIKPDRKDWTWEEFKQTFVYKCSYDKRTNQYFLLKEYNAPSRLF